jgi:nicotinamide-nucleotide amidase
VEVLAVGTELLLGQIVNSNAAEIGERLAAAGLTHTHQVVVGDNLERIADAIRTAVGRADALIITGGIGPTQDDITREAICEAGGLEMDFSEEYADHLREWWARRGREMPETNLRQASYPAGAEMIENLKGTAPGLKVKVGDAWVFAVPGVPQEMLPMVEETIIPFLVEESGDEAGVIESLVLRTHGESESRIAALLDDMFTEYENPTMAFLASAAEIKIRLTARAATREGAQALIAPVADEVRRRLGPLVFAEGMEPIESIVLGLAREKGWTIGTVESATGGLFASRFTGVPGASDTFRGALVTYATDLKTGLAGVPQQVIDEYGVVSEETALAMAEHGAEVLGVDVCLSVTGSAGPDPMEAPAGTMFFAVRTPEDARVLMRRMPGDRERVRTYSTTVGLHLVRRAILGDWWR